MDGVAGAFVEHQHLFSLQLIQYQYNTRAPVLQYNANVIPMQYYIFLALDAEKYVIECPLVIYSV
jgi:hypothetical protein